MQSLILLRDAIVTRWRLMLAVIVLTTAGTTVAVYVRPPSFESDAALFVNVQQHQLSVARADVRVDGAALQAVEAVTSHAEGLRSRILAEMVVDKIDPKIFDRPRSSNVILRTMSATVNYVRDTGEDFLRWIKLMPSKDPRYDLIKKIEDGFDVSTVRQAQVIKLSFRAENPKTAQTVLQALVDTYIALNAERVMGADILTEKAAALRPQLEDAERELGLLKAQYGIVDLNGEKSTLSERISRLTTILDGGTDTAFDPAAAGVRVAGKETVAAANATQRSVLDVQDDPASGGVASTQVVQLRAQLNRHRLERAGLLDTYSPGRANVGPMDTRIENLKQQLDQEIARIRDTVGGYRARLDTLLKVEPQINQLMRNVSMLSDTYEVYRKEAQDRRIARTQDALEQLRVIDPPSVPYVPRGLLPVLIVLSGFGAGIVLSLGVALVMNVFTTMIAQHEAATGHPAIAAAEVPLIAASQAREESRSQFP